MLLTRLSYAAGKHQQVLGAGGTARVFKGSYRGKPVAVKMMFCVELDAELVNTFCEEAGMLAQLQHRNVVRLEGLCVVPPALCLVMELCEFGSLYSFLREMGEELSWRQRLSLCADCARAVAFLHQQSPPLLHMDIKRCERRGIEGATDLKGHGERCLTHTAPVRQPELPGERGHACEDRGPGGVAARGDNSGPALHDT